MAIPITEAFKRFRREFNLSQREVAKRLNISQPAYAVYETKGNTPNGNTLIKIATEFNVSTDYLLGLTDDPRPYHSQHTEQKAEVDDIQVIKEQLVQLKETLAKQGIKI